MGSLAAVAFQGGGAEKYQPVVRDWVWLEGVPVTADGGLCFRLPTHLFGWAQVLLLAGFGLQLHSRRFSSMAASIVKIISGHWFGKAH